MIIVCSGSNSAYSVWKVDIFFLLLSQWEAVFEVDNNVRDTSICLNNEQWCQFDRYLAGKGVAGQFEDTMMFVTVQIPCCQLVTWRTNAVRKSQHYSDEITLNGLCNKDKSYRLDWNFNAKPTCMMRYENDIVSGFWVFMNGLWEEVCWNSVQTVD